MYQAESENVRPSKEACINGQIAEIEEIVSQARDLVKDYITEGLVGKDHQAITFLDSLIDRLGYIKDGTLLIVDAISNIKGKLGNL